MKIGRTRRKLSEVLTKTFSQLENADVLISPEDLWTQKGDYRKNTWDLARWGADVKYRRRDGVTISLQIHSLDTMADCLRGFEISGPGHKDLPGVRCVTAKTVNP